MSTIATQKSARLGLRTTAQQEAVLRRAAQITNKTLTDFIIEAAYQAAEQTLLDQRLFMLDAKTFDALEQQLDQPAKNNAGLADLFSRNPVW